jgi:hypothetical protein
MNIIQTLQHLFPKIHFKITFPSTRRSFKWSLPFRLSKQFYENYMSDVPSRIMIFTKINQYRRAANRKTFFLKPVMHNPRHAGLCLTARGSLTNETLRTYNVLLVQIIVTDSRHHGMLFRQVAGGGDGSKLALGCYKPGKPTRGGVTVQLVYTLKVPMSQNAKEERVLNGHKARHSTNTITLLWKSAKRMLISDHTKQF